EIEVKNILNALNKLLDEVVNRNKISLITPRLLKKFHKMVGRGLGKHFDAIPGKYRTDQRIVGTYRAPDHQDVVPLTERLCKWLQEEFHYSRSQPFIDSIIQAIVTHVYIEWIHPFADGNGRTGRLIEFYILLKSGTPDIASHILSNFYNDTRPEYYRQLDEANKTQDLTSFIEYAVQGYRDGLIETLEIIRASLFEISWQKLIYDFFADKKYVKKEAFRRKRDLILQMPTDKDLTLEEMVLINPQIARSYAKLSERTVDRDLKELQQMRLIVKHGDKYRANLNLLKHMVPAQIAS
ncbi:Fic family protein, partial [bacterium]|nr:Fic family protein [bacterium]